MPLDRKIEEIADCAGIAEGLAALEPHPVEDFREHLLGLRIEGEDDVFVVLGEPHAEELLELAGIVVRELDSDVHPSRQAGVHTDEIAHFLCVTGHYAHELALAILQQGHERVHGVAAIALGAVSIMSVQGVSLIDKEHAAHRLVHIFLHVLLRIAQVASDEILAGYLHELAGGQGTYGIKHFAEFAGEGSLTGARVACEEEMVGDELVLHALLLLGFDVADYGLYFLLHALKAHIIIQLRENLILALGDETLGCVYVLGLDGLAAAGHGLDIDALGHHLREMAIGVAQTRLAHIPGEMGVQFLRKVLRDAGTVFFFQKL